MRILDFLTFLSFALFIILGVGKLDGWEDLPFGVIFTPYFIYESLKFFTNIKQAFLGVIAIEEIEEMYKKNVFEMTAEERAEVDAIYSVIAPSMSAEYRDGLKKKVRGLLVCRGGFEGQCCNARSPPLPHFSPHRCSPRRAPRSPGHLCAPWCQFSLCFN